MAEAGGGDGGLSSFKEPVGFSDLMDSKRMVFDVDTFQYQEGGEDDQDELYDNHNDDYVDLPIDLGGTGGNKKLPFAKLIGNHPDYKFAWFGNNANVKSMEQLLDDGGVMKKVVREGMGPALLPNQGKVHVQYAMSGPGMNEEVFDSTILIKRALCVSLEEPSVIKGLFVAIQSMRVKEIAKFWIRSDYAYGKFGCPPRIPQNFDVFAIVEILDYVTEAETKIEKFPREQRAALPFQEILNCAMELKESGKKLHLDRAYGFAARAYHKAASILEDYPTATASENNARQQLLYILHSNLADAYLQLEQFNRVCIQCRAAMNCVDKDTGVRAEAKLFYRWAQAKMRLGSPSEALRLNKKAEKRAPNHDAVQKQRQEILAQVEKDKKASTLLYKKIGEKMFNSSPPVDK